MHWIHRRISSLKRITRLKYCAVQNIIVKHCIIWPRGPIDAIIVISWSRLNLIISIITFLANKKHSENSHWWKVDQILWISLSGVEWLCFVRESRCPIVENSLHADAIVLGCILKRIATSSRQFVCNSTFPLRVNKLRDMWRRCHRQCACVKPP